MKAYIVTWLILIVIEVIYRLGMLGFADYPRTYTRNRGEDAITLMLWIAFGVWGFNVVN